MKRPVVLMLVMGTLCAVGVFGLGIYFGIVAAIRPPQVAAPGAALAFDPAEPGPKDFQQLFDEYGACLRNKGAGGERFWDTRRFTREVNRDGVFTRNDCDPNDPGTLAIMHDWVATKVNEHAWYLFVDEIKIRSVRWLVPDREAVIEAKHTRRTDGRVERNRDRWWAVWNNGWRIYDHEDVTVGSRFTTERVRDFAAHFARGGADDPDVIAAEDLFNEARKAHTDGDLSKAERLLADPKLKRLPRESQVSLALWRASTAMRLGKYAAGRDCLDAAASDHPGAAAIFDQQADCFYRMGDYEGSLAATDRYIKLIGPDDGICRVRGNALVKLKRLPEAAAAYRQSLDDEPDSAVVLDGLRKCLKAGETKEIETRFRAFRDPGRDLGYLVDCAEDDPALIEAYVRVVREKSPTNPEGLFQAARLRLTAKDDAGATALFVQAIGADAKRETEFLSRFAGEMAQRHRPGVAYAVLPDKYAERGFRALAEAIEEEFDVDTAEAQKDLESLLSAHRKKKPDDVWLAYFEAVLLRAQGHYDGAEKCLADAMKRVSDDNDRERFRWLRVDNLAAAGRIADAYRTVGPRRKTFDQLAGRLYRVEDVPALTELIASHAQEDATDPNLSLYRGQAHFRKKEYEAAVGHFENYRKASNDGDRVSTWRVSDSLVRSLLRLKRFDAAREALGQKDGPGYYNRILAVAITAASGDVAETERQLDDLSKDNLASPASIHADPDLSAALKTEPFKKVLAKYPPPAPTKK